VRIDNPALVELAAAYGVATEYLDQLQRSVQVTEESVVAVLGALGVDASSPTAIRDALAAEHDRAAEAPPIVVLRSAEHRTLHIRGLARLTLEAGESRKLTATDEGLTIPAGLPLGWHRLDTSDGEIPVVVVPAVVLGPADGSGDPPDCSSPLHAASATNEAPAPPRSSTRRVVRTPMGRA